MPYRLILMRHAKSDHGDRTLADHDRPLNPRGRRDSPRMADWLEQMDLIPDLVLSSSSVRTRETLELMMQRWEQPPQAVFSENLYLATSQTIFMTICSQTPSVEKVMVLGHNPGISYLATELAAEPLQMPTAAIAAFEVDFAPTGVAESVSTSPVSPWADLGGEQCQLGQFATPKGIGDR